MSLSHLYFLFLCVMLRALQSCHWSNANGSSHKRRGVFPCALLSPLSRGRPRRCEPPRISRRRRVRRRSFDRGLTWSSLAAEETDEGAASTRRPLVVKPVLIYRIAERRPQESWRGWGGVQSRQAVEQEIVRIQGELDKLRATADFPVEFRPIAKATPDDLDELTAANGDVATADVVLAYASSGTCSGRTVLNALTETAKNIIVFCRHKSGPLYLWYEIVSPYYLRQHTDELAVDGADYSDVVIDSQDEILWRLRSLCGLVNTVGGRVLTIGGPSGWAGGNSPQLARERYKLDIQTVPYDELGRLIKEARADSAAVEQARRRADEYLNLPGTTLETKREFVDNAFLLETIFRRLLKKADCRAITIKSCMGTIIPLAETTACLPLSTLNDAGYLAFCESDFVVVPGGMLMGNIAGKPQFMNDPTYPHDGIITLAHCTGPRKMNGSRIEPARILTHFESDYGTAPKVEMPRGQTVTNLIADFSAKRYVGLLGEIVDAPFLPICRDQIEVRYNCDTDELARRMPGFHWMTCYGDYLKEIGYALRRIGIEWENMG